MMKRKISLLLAILMLITLMPSVFAESKTVDAVKSTQKFALDGKEVKVAAYNIQGNNYLKLRDLAALLNGKKTQFSVGYDKEKNLVIIKTSKSYEKLDTDLQDIKDAKAKALLSVKKVLLNGEAKDIKAALINSNNYMQLRDLGAITGFGVAYDADSKTVIIDSEGSAKLEENDEEEIDQEELAILERIDEANKKKAPDYVLKVYKALDSYHDLIAEGQYDVASVGAQTFTQTEITGDQVKKLAEVLKNEKTNKVGAKNIFTKKYKTRSDFNLDEKLYRFERTYDYGKNSTLTLEYFVNLEDKTMTLFHTVNKKLTDKTYQKLSKEDKDEFKYLEEIYKPLVEYNVDKFRELATKKIDLQKEEANKVITSAKTLIEINDIDTSTLFKKVREIAYDGIAMQYKMIFRYENDNYLQIVLRKMDGYTTLHLFIKNK